jgi:hypothetical protein
MESPNSQSDSGNYSPELSIISSAVKSPEPLQLLADSSLLQVPMQPQQVPTFNMQSLLSGGQPQAPAQEAMHAPAAPKEDGMLNPKQFFHLQKAILGKFIKLCWNCNEINFHNQNKFQFLMIKNTLAVTQSFALVVLVVIWKILFRSSLRATRTIRFGGPRLRMGGATKTLSAAETASTRITTAATILERMAAAAASCYRAAKASGRAAAAASGSSNSAAAASIARRKASRTRASWCSSALPDRSQSP